MVPRELIEDTITDIEQTSEMYFDWKRYVLPQNSDHSFDF